MKRLLAIFLVLVFCISTLTVNGLAETTNEKAEVLNQLNILKGSSGGYNLSGKLKRTEAAAFIVRLMGYEKQVTEKANLYSIFSYPDIDASKWYASYIGYCSINKIISGNGQGNFEPDKDISEKSFLKLVLCALGYVYNEDFSWNEVYNQAYKTGLVKDIAYTFKSEDDTNFVRAQAVDILYNSLRLINQSTGKEMFYSLIDNGAITKEAARAAGLIKDEIITKLVNVTALDRNMVFLKFNENITLEDITIFESDNEATILASQLYSQEENEVILKTSNQKSGIEYKVTISGVTDEGGNVIENLTGIFKGYQLDVQEIESEFFRIKKIEPVNETTIRIYFTHPVNINSEVNAYYKVFSGNQSFADGTRDEIAVKVLSKPDNIVSLSLIGRKFDPDDIYSLEINGILTSLYGVRLNDGAGDAMDFMAAREASEPFALTEIIPYSSKTILLNFNKEINEFLAKQIYNFYVTDEKSTPLEIAGTAVLTAGNNAGKGLFINMKSEFIKNDKYHVTINNLNDSSRLEYISEKMYTFAAKYGNASKTNVKNVSAIDSQTLEVRFANPLSAGTATIPDYYYIQRTDYGAVPEKVYYNPDIDPYTVKLYLKNDDKLSKKTYALQVSENIQDYLGNPVDSSTLKVFTGSKTEISNLAIASAVAISSDAVKLTFGKEIALDAPNILPGNYTLTCKKGNTEYKKVPLSVLYINASTLILKFDALEYDVVYTLRYGTIKDYCGYEITGTDASAKSFTLVKEE